jgi:hypothetical protein
MTTITTLTEYMFGRDEPEYTRNESRLAELIFNRLEEADIMHRTVGGLLPEQNPMMTIPDYVPASLATVQFAPIGSDSAQSLFRQKLVIPLSVRVPLHAVDEALPLSFISNPVAPTPVMPTEREDDANGQPAQPKPVTSPEKEKIAEDSSLTAEAASGKIAPIKPRNVSADQRRVADDNLIEPECGAPPNSDWIALYVKTTQAPVLGGPDLRRVFWASVWLFFHGANSPKCEAIILASGYYAFLGSFLSNAARTAYSAALRENNLDLRSLSQFWVMERISPTNPRFTDLFEGRRDARRRSVMQLDAQTGAIISDALDGGTRRSDQLIR